MPALGSRRVVNPVSALSWWKIFDNLRRSLMPIAMLAALLSAWLWVPRLGTGTTLLVMTTVGAGGDRVAAVERPPQASRLGRCCRTSA